MESSTPNMDDVIGICEGCSRSILDTDAFHSGPDVYLCEDCAPSYSDMAAHPDSFIDMETGEPMTQERAAEIVETWVASGGKVSDKMVVPHD